MIETVCYLINQLHEELDLEHIPEVEVKLCFVKSSVSCVREKITNDEIDKTRCLVYFNNGESLEIGMSYNELIKKL